MILSDREIEELCIPDADPTGINLAFAQKPMLSPFVDRSVNKTEDGVKILSYGLSSYGYDARLARKIYLFTNQNGVVIDPRNFSNDVYVEARILQDEDGLEYFILPPNSYALGHTVEYFRMPRDVTAICLGKSTYARSAVLVNATVIEAGWEGQVVLEIASMCGLPVKVYVEQGIAQFLFLKGRECEVSYADRGGKYQNQTSIQLPKV